MHIIFHSCHPIAAWLAIIATEVDEVFGRIEENDDVAEKVKIHNWSIRSSNNHCINLQLSSVYTLSILYLIPDYCIIAVLLDTVSANQSPTVSVNGLLYPEIAVSSHAKYCSEMYSAAHFMHFNNMSNKQEQSYVAEIEQVLQMFHKRFTISYL